MTKKEYLEELYEYIPSGAQTLSKNPGQYVIGVTPVTAERAEGVYIWDNEGNKYLDLLSALGPFVLGYGNTRVNEAVKQQIDKGTVFSLPAAQELTLAKTLRKVVPCAEMSRFMLNGNDATSGAVRLARHITGREHVAKCGYHGWQDWSIAPKAGRNNGVPASVKALTHEFSYNDPESLEKILTTWPEQIAAVVLEPVITEPPQDGFLEKVQQLAKQHGALLVFDEMVTGFRWALGGAQEFFGVVPDLACFGKAISNGFPLAALCGKSVYMRRMDEVFVSMTFGGYLPGIAAALETIAIMQETGDVQGHLHAIGQYLIAEGNRVASETGAPFSFVGYGPHPVLTIMVADDLTSRIIKTFLYQEMNEAGILFNSSMMMSYAHRQEHVDYFINAFRRASAKIVEWASDYSQLASRLKGPVVAPRAVRNQQ